MAHDETLARRICDLLASKKGYTEKRCSAGCLSSISATDFSQNRRRTG